MRLDKFICQGTQLSRSEVKKYLKAGAVSCHGTRIKDAGYKVSPEDEIKLAGQVVRLTPLRYLMLNKPQEVICSSQDELYPSVLSLLQPAQDVQQDSLQQDSLQQGSHSQQDIQQQDSLQQDSLQQDSHQDSHQAQVHQQQSQFLPDFTEQLHIAGRLDVDTTGLVLITDDGQWSHRVTSPKKACGKRYRVTVAEPMDETLIPVFAAGMVLRNESKPTKAAKLELISSHQALLTLTEGKYHQVKRMFAACGNRVTELHREQIGAIVLDPSLKLGQWRYLTEEEIASV